MSREDIISKVNFGAQDRLDGYFTDNSNMDHPFITSVVHYNSFGLIEKIIRIELFKKIDVLSYYGTN